MIHPVGKPCIWTIWSLVPSASLTWGKYPQTLDYELSVLFHTKDGEVLTCEDLGLDLAIRDIPGPADVFGREFAEIVYTSKTVIDLTQIEAIVLDGQEVFIGQ